MHTLMVLYGQPDDPADFADGGATVLTLVS